MKMVQYFKALSDTTRLRLLNLCLYHELNVNEIVEILNMGQSRISRHLKILTDTQLLSSRRDGLWTFYSSTLNGKGFRFLQTIKYLFKEEKIFAQDVSQAKIIIDKRSKATTRFFDSIAEDWVQLKAEIFGDFDLNDLILKNTTESDTIVDLGCGAGDLLSPLKKKCKTVIGVDKSPKMLEEARKRFPQPQGKIDLRIGDIEHLPLRDFEADAAIINMVLHHLPDPFAAFKEVNRILKRGNFFIIIDFLKHNREDMRVKYGDRWLGFTEKEIKSWLNKAGFDLIQIKYFNLKKELNGFIIKAAKNNWPGEKQNPESPRGKGDKNGNIRT
jgi:ArsR family transcriptional regulator